MIVDQLFENKKTLAEDHEDCDLCSGTGEGMYDGESCPQCHGTGTVRGQHDDDDFDIPDNDYEPDYDEESYYEKSLRSRGLGESRQRRLNEAMLMEDPIYRNFKHMGQYIAERRMSEKEILQVFRSEEHTSELQSH